MAGPKTPKLAAADPKSSERFIKEQPKQLAAFVRAVVKGLRVARQERESTIAAISKFSELDKTLSTRMYDDLVGIFTKNGYVDEQSQKNTLPSSPKSPTSTMSSSPSAYDFSFASKLSSS